MFKVAAVDAGSLKEARSILARIYNEQPDYWPYGLSPEHFDGGLYLVREKQSNAAVGFVGWQERDRFEKIADVGRRRIKVGYYSIGILPEYRNNGLAKEAVAKLVAIKSAGVDKVEALIMSHNNASMALARSLAIPVQRVKLI